MLPSHSQGNQAAQRSGRFHRLTCGVGGGGARPERRAKGGLGGARLPLQHAARDVWIAQPFARVIGGLHLQPEAAVPLRQRLQ